MFFEIAVPSACITQVMETRGTAIAVVHAHQGAYCTFAGKINSHQLSPCNTLSNGISHMQIDAAIAYAAV